MYTSGFEKPEVRIEAIELTKRIIRIQLTFQILGNLINKPVKDSIGFNLC